MDRRLAQAELDRLWMGQPDQDSLRLPPAWLLDYYGLTFDDRAPVPSTRTTDLTDEDIDACL